MELGEHDVDDRVGLALAIAYNVGEGGAGPRQRPQVVRLRLRAAPLCGVPRQEPQGKGLGVDCVVLHLPHAHRLAPVGGEQGVHLEDLVAAGLEERDEVAPVMAGGLQAHARFAGHRAGLGQLGEQGREPLAVVAELEIEQSPLASLRDNRGRVLSLGQVDSYAATHLCLLPSRGHVAWRDSPRPGGAQPLAK